MGWATKSSEISRKRDGGAVGYQIREPKGPQEPWARSPDAPVAPSTSSPKHTSPQAAPGESSRFINGSQPESYSVPKSVTGYTCPQFDGRSLSAQRTGKSGTK